MDQRLVQMRTADAKSRPLGETRIDRRVPTDKADSTVRITMLPWELDT
jgi:hypothetical protein